MSAKTHNTCPSQTHNQGEGTNTVPPNATHQHYIMEAQPQGEEEGRKLRDLGRILLDDFVEEGVQADLEDSLGRGQLDQAKAEKKGKKVSFRQGWTREEHIRFLLGVQKYGKGNWKSISKIVTTKSPKQVQSHAQKYFLRQQQQVKNKRSIHDFSLDDLANLMKDPVYRYHITHRANLGVNAESSDIIQDLYGRISTPGASNTQSEPNSPQLPSPNMVVENKAEAQQQQQQQTPITHNTSNKPFHLPHISSLLNDNISSYDDNSNNIPSLSSSASASTTKSKQSYPQFPPHGGFRSYAQSTMDYSDEQQQSKRRKLNDSSCSHNNNNTNPPTETKNFYIGSQVNYNNQSTENGRNYSQQYFNGGDSSCGAVNSTNNGDDKSFPNQQQPISDFNSNSNNNYNTTSTMYPFNNTVEEQQNSNYIRRSPSIHVNVKVELDHMHDLPNTLPARAQYYNLESLLYSKESERRGDTTRDSQPDSQLSSKHPMDLSLITNVKGPATSSTSRYSRYVNHSCTQNTQYQASSNNVVKNLWTNAPPSDAHQQRDSFSRTGTDNHLTGQRSTLTHNDLHLHNMKHHPNYPHYRDGLNDINVDINMNNTDDNTIGNDGLNTHHYRRQI